MVKIVHKKQSFIDWQRLCKNSGLIPKGAYVNSRLYDHRLHECQTITSFLKIQEFTEKPTEIHQNWHCALLKQSWTNLYMFLKQLTKSGKVYGRNRRWRKNWTCPRYFLTIVQVLSHWRQSQNFLECLILLMTYSRFHHLLQGKEYGTRAIISRG